MKVFKKVLCLMLVCLTLGGLCACNSDSNSSRSPLDVIRHEVEARGYSEYGGRSIGGNKLTRSSATITDITKLSETQYRVSGKVVMVDVYGTKWSNTFNCTVTYTGSSCKVGTFNYTSNKWSKG